MTCEELLTKRALPPVWGNAPKDRNQRRGEIKELLQREVYGYLPEAPQTISFFPCPVNRRMQIFAPARRLFAESCSKQS